jgi:hypothetical protein
MKVMYSGMPAITAPTMKSARSGHLCRADLLERWIRVKPAVLSIKAQQRCSLLLLT